MKQLVILIISDYITNLYEIVKDKDNQLNYNVWSCGDFDTIPISKRVSNCVAEISNEWAYNGEHSLKLSGIKWDWAGFQIIQKISVQTIQLSSNIYSNTTNQFRIQLIDSNNETTSYSISNSAGESNPLINIPLTHEIQRIDIHIVLLDEGIVFMDNINLKLICKRETQLM